MISAPDRQNALELIRNACRSGARLSKACQTMGISLRTYQRWRRSEDALYDKRPGATRGRPSFSLTEEERHEILTACNTPEFQNMSPAQIVPTLADRGVYLASESSFYRILRDEGQNTRRGRSRAPRPSKPPRSHTATAPNQVWSWDITFLHSTIAGHFYRLYLILDIFSRKIVGWEIHENESSDHASTLIAKACLAESVKADQLVLHSDNGSPMKGATMLAMLQRLGIVASFNRPSVSNDNAYSESLFRHLKYTPAYPERAFESLDAARLWVHEFVRWYNNIHKHSGLKYVTPQQKHQGEDLAILASRHQVYLASKAKNPARWSRTTRNWSPISSVTLNPTKDDDSPPSLIESTA